MKKFITALKSNTFIYILGVFFIVGIWYIISLSQGHGNIVFPLPHETFVKTGEILSKAYIYKCIGWTILRTLIGFGIAFASALILGLLSGRFPKVYVFLKPLVIVLKSAPTAAFIFLFLILVGSKFASIFIVILIAFPILFEAVVGGLNSISPEVNDAMRIDTGNALIAFFQVKLPLAIPYIVVGLLSSLALSFKTSIMAEIIAGDTNYGLGSAIIAYRSMDPTDLTPIFAVTLIAILLVLIVDIVTLVIKFVLHKKQYID